MQFLRQNQRSLSEQSDPDYQHIIIEDVYQRGVEYANGQMAARDWSDVEGEYVLILDDDDLMADDLLVLKLKRHTYYSDNDTPPDLFMVRMDHGQWGILPAETWEGEPQKGRQGCSCVIPSRAIFLEAVKSYTPKYDGDFDFVSACYGLSENIHWLDTVATRVQQIGALTKV